MESWDLTPEGARGPEEIAQLPFIPFSVVISFICDNSDLFYFRRRSGKGVQSGLRPWTAFSGRRPKDRNLVWRSDWEPRSCCWAGRGSGAAAAARGSSVLSSSTKAIST